MMYSFNHKSLSNDKEGGKIGDSFLLVFFFCKNFHSTSIYKLESVRDNLQIVVKGKEQLQVQWLI